MQDEHFNFWHNFLPKYPDINLNELKNVVQPILDSVLEPLDFEKIIAQNLHLFNGQGITSQWRECLGKETECAQARLDACSPHPKRLSVDVPPLPPSEEEAVGEPTSSDADITLLDELEPIVEEEEPEVEIEEVEVVEVEE